MVGDENGSFRDEKSRSGVIVNGGSPHGAIAIIQSKFKIGLVSNAIEDSLSSFPLRTIPSKLKIQSDDNYSDTDDGTYFQNYSGDVLISGMSPLFLFSATGLHLVLFTPA